MSREIKFSHIGIRLKEAKSVQSYSRDSVATETAASRVPLAPYAAGAHSAGRPGSRYNMQLTNLPAPCACELGSC
ncbi:unnamed protein product, partial [Iphiclides podalirius]